MSYKHILVAVDLSESSEKVIDKAVSLAKGENAKLSLIFVDVDSITNLKAANTLIPELPSIEEREASLQAELQVIADGIDYPIESAVVEIGPLNAELKNAIKEKDVDLLICGHHHDFWSRLLSTVNKLVNSVVTDLLIVYL